MTLSRSSVFTQLNNRLKFKHLALLVALDRLHNLHQAADELNIAQPSASKMLSDIESTFGFMLFERLPRGMTPTALGLEVIAYARQHMTELTHFSQTMDIKRKGGHGQLLIGSIMGVLPDLLAQAVSELKAARPLLTIRLLGETSDHVLSLLKEREVELAVGRFSNPLQKNEFNFSHLANEPVSLVVQYKHPLAVRKRLDLSELVNWPWITQFSTSPSRQLLEEEFSKVELPFPSNVVECSSMFATLQLLQTSDAVSLLSKPVTRDYIRAGLLVELPIDIGKTLMGYGLLIRKRETLSEPAERFIEILKRHSALMT